MTGGLALACWLAAGVYVHGQEPIVQPGDISTPTPTPLALPTPTPGSAVLLGPAVSVETTPPTVMDGSNVGPHLDAPAVSPQRVLHHVRRLDNAARLGRRVRARQKQQIRPPARLH